MPEACDLQVTRRRFLEAVVGGASAATVPSLGSAAPAARRQPNILWIMTDDHRPDTLGCTGSPWLKTPHLDGIARRGVVMRHAFSQNPICTPSRSSLMTGRYCHAINVMSNGYRLRPDAPFLTRPLQEAGYQLINVGKKLPSPKIFDIQVKAPGYGGPGATPYELKAPWTGKDAELGVLHLKDLFPVIIAGRYPLPASQTEPAITVSNAIRLLEQGLRSPFMLRVSIIAPHTPILPPEPFDRMYEPSQIPFEPPSEEELRSKPRWEREMLRNCQGSTHLSKGQIQRSRACYAGLVSHVDDEIGRLLAVLEQRGLLDDMLVIVTSDQGVCLGEHGLFMKRNFYEQSAGAICMAAWPGRLPEGQVVDEPVGLIDVMPTILDAAGIPLPGTAQGRSLLPLMTGQAERTGETFCEIDFLRPQVDRYYLPNSRRVMVRTAEWKMSCFVDRQGADRDGDLYHMTEDPEEKHNLWSDRSYADVVAQLEGRIRRWQEDTQ